MKNYLYIFACFIFIINSIKSDAVTPDQVEKCEANNNDPEDQKKDWTHQTCNNLLTEDELSTIPEFACCLVKYKYGSKSVKKCHLIHKSSDAITKYEKNGLSYLDSVKVSCNSSSYLKLGFLLLLFALFF